MDEEKNFRTVGGQKAGYLFEFKPDGVFLTVYPSVTGELSFELSDMRQILQDFDVLDYDIVELSRLVREASGHPAKISESFQEPPEEYFARMEAKQEGEEVEELEGSSNSYPGIIVEVSKDRLEAKVRYDMTKGTKLPSTQMIMDALQEKNVVFGIDLAAIETGVKSLLPFVAAKGQPPVHGENAYIDRRFDLGVKGKPVVDQYDRVDYKNLNLFVMVRRNDVLAVRIPQTQGTPGKNVYGDEVAARNGRPIPMPEGKNTRVIGEDELIATIDGQVVDTGRIISVDPHLVLKNGVNMGTGNIDFTGSIEIKGDVEQGFLVKATGDIEITGTVNGAVIEGRNVLVSGGINGQNRCRIRAKEDIRAAFVETAELSADRDIYINDVALHSQLRAGKRIYIEGKKGQLTGGLAAAGEEIKATQLGNQATVITRVAVGVDPNLQKEYREACKRVEEAKKRLQQITQTLNTLSKIDISRLPEERISQINAMTRSQFPLAGQIKRDEAKMKKLEHELSEMKNGRILVSGTLYPGVRVTINSVRRNFDAEAKHCSLSVVEDRVEIGLYP